MNSLSSKPVEFDDDCKKRDDKHNKKKFLTDSIYLQQQLESRKCISKQNSSSCIIINNRRSRNKLNSNKKIKTINYNKICYSDTKSKNEHSHKKNNPSKVSKLSKISNLSKLSHIKISHNRNRTNENPLRSNLINKYKQTDNVYSNIYMCFNDDEDKFLNSFQDKGMKREKKVNFKSIDFQYYKADLKKENRRIKDFIKLNINNKNILEDSDDGYEKINKKKNTTNIIQTSISPKSHNTTNIKLNNIKSVLENSTNFKSKKVEKQSIIDNNKNITIKPLGKDKKCKEINEVNKLKTADRSKNLNERKNSLNIPILDLKKDNIKNTCGSQKAFKNCNNSRENRDSNYDFIMETEECLLKSEETNNNNLFSINNDNTKCLNTIESNEVINNHNNINNKIIFKSNSLSLHKRSGNLIDNFNNLDSKSKEYHQINENNNKDNQNNEMFINIINNNESPMNNNLKNINNNTNLNINNLNFPCHSLDNNSSYKILKVISNNNSKNLTERTTKTSVKTKSRFINNINTSKISNNKNPKLKNLKKQLKAAFKKLTEKKLINTDFYNFDYPNSLKILNTLSNINNNKNSNNKESNKIVITSIQKNQEKYNKNEIFYHAYYKNKLTMNEFLLFRLKISVTKFKETLDNRKELFDIINNSINSEFNSNNVKDYEQNKEVIDYADIEKNLIKEVKNNLISKSMKKVTTYKSSQLTKLNNTNTFNTDNNLPLAIIDKIELSEEEDDYDKEYKSRLKNNTLKNQQLFNNNKASVKKNITNTLKKLITRTNFPDNSNNINNNSIKIKNIDKKYSSLDNKRILQSNKILPRLTSNSISKFAKGIKLKTSDKSVKELRTIESNNKEMLLNTIEGHYKDKLLSDYLSNSNKALDDISNIKGFYSNNKKQSSKSNFIRSSYDIMCNIKSLDVVNNKNNKNYSMNKLNKYRSILNHISEKKEQTLNEIINSDSNLAKKLIPLKKLNIENNYSISVSNKSSCNESLEYKNLLSSNYSNTNNKKSNSNSVDNYSKSSKPKSLFKTKPHNDFIIKDNGDIDDLNNNNYNSEKEEKENNEIKKIQNTIETRSRYLFKQSKVYDSLSNDEDDNIQENKDHFLMIHENSYFIYIWDHIIFFVTLFTLFFTPISIAFDNPLTQKFQSMEILRIAFDFIYIIDIVICFFIPYYNEDEILVKNLKMISRNYTRKWFGIDLIASLPVNIIFFFLGYSNYLNLEDHRINHSSYFANNYDQFYNNPSNMNSYLNKNIFYDYSYFKYDFYFNNESFYKKISLFKLLNMLKVLKVIKTKRKKENSVEEVSGVKYLSQFAFWFLTCTHITSCLYIFIGMTNLNSWIIQYNLTEESNISLYVDSIYFHWTTILTIGYGDICSNNITERVYNIFLMLIGIAVYSYVVTSMGNILSKVSVMKLKYNKNIDILNSLSSTYKLSDKFYDKIRQYINYDYRMNLNDRYKFFADLPKITVNKLLSNMHKELISTMHYLSNAGDNDFVIQVVMCLKPMCFFQREKLFEENQIVEEMFFVKSGRLGLCLGKKYGEAKVIEIRKNEHFGDIFCLSSQKSPYILKVLSKRAELLIIKKENLIKISENFPVCFEKLFNVSKYNHYIMLEVSEKLKMKIEKEGMMRKQSHKSMMSRMSKKSQKQGEGNDQAKNNVDDVFGILNIKNEECNNKEYSNESNEYENSNNCFDDNEVQDDSLYSNQNHTNMTRKNIDISRNNISYNTYELSRLVDSDNKKQLEITNTLRKYQDRRFSINPNKVNNNLKNNENDLSYFPAENEDLFNSKINFSDYINNLSYLTSHNNSGIKSCTSINQRNNLSNKSNINFNNNIPKFKNNNLSYYDLKNNSDNDINNTCFVPNNLSKKNIDKKSMLGINKLNETVFTNNYINNLNNNTVLAHNNKNINDTNINNSTVINKRGNKNRNLSLCIKQKRDKRNKLYQTDALRNPKKTNLKEEEIDFFNNHNINKRSSSIEGTKSVLPKISSKFEDFFNFNQLDQKNKEIVKKEMKTKLVPDYKKNAMLLSNQILQDCQVQTLHKRKNELNDIFKIENKDLKLKKLKKNIDGSEVKNNSSINHNTSNLVLSPNLKRRFGKGNNPNFSAIVNNNHNNSILKVKESKDNKENRDYKDQKRDISIFNNESVYVKNITDNIKVEDKKEKVYINNNKKAIKGLNTSYLDKYKKLVNKTKINNDSNFITNDNNDTNLYNVDSEHGSPLYNENINKQVHINKLFAGMERNEDINKNYMNKDNMNTDSNKTKPIMQSILKNNSYFNNIKGFNNNNNEYKENYLNTNKTNKKITYFIDDNNETIKDLDDNKQQINNVEDNKDKLRENSIINLNNKNNNSQKYTYKYCDTLNIIKEVEGIDIKVKDGISHENKDSLAYNNLEKKNNNNNILKSELFNINQLDSIGKLILSNKSNKSKNKYIDQTIDSQKLDIATESKVIVENKEEDLNKKSLQSNYNIKNIKNITDKNVKSKINSNNNNNNKNNKNPIINNIFINNRLVFNSKEKDLNNEINHGRFNSQSNNYYFDDYNINNINNYDLEEEENYSNDDNAVKEESFDNSNQNNDKR